MLKRLRDKYLAIILFSFLCVFGAGFINVNTTQAYTNIPSKNIKKIATFKLSHNNSHQGGVVTEKYFVYLDCSDHCAGGGEAVIIDRNNCQLVKKVKLAKRVLSGPSYKWRSDYISLIYRGRRQGCIKLDGKKSRRTSSGCFQPEGAELNSPGSPQGAPANFNGYRFKVAGLYTPTALGVFKDSSTNKIAEFRIPEKYGEPEGVSIDCKTGEVYIDFDKNNPRRALFYKINYKKLQRYTGKQQTSNPVKCSAIGKIDGSSSSGNNSKDKDSSSSGSSASGTAGNHNIPYEQPESPGTDGTVHTNFFGDFQDDGTGCGVYMLLDSIIEILTYGIAILATIGLIVAGITYMTAKDNPSQVIKAKRRIVDIVLGLITYALLWSILNFVLPGGNFNNSTQCGEATSNHGLFDTKPVEIRPVTTEE